MDDSVNREVYTGFEEEIDLWEYIQVLIKRKWFILGFVSISVLAAGVFSFGFLEPTYESEASFLLPPEGSQLGLSPQAYLDLAASENLLSKVIASEDLDLRTDGLRRSLDFTLKEGDRILGVKASARSIEDAARLIGAWHNAFQDEVNRVISDQLKAQTQVFEELSESTLVELTEARSALSEFDIENPIAFWQKQLAEYQNRLVSNDIRLRELAVTLKNKKEQLKSVEDQLETVPMNLDDSAVTVLPEGDLGRSGNSYLVLVNPVYLDLVQQRADLRSELAGVTGLMEAISGEQDELKTMVETLQDRIETTQVNRAELERALEKANREYQEAEAKTVALRMQGGLSEIAEVKVLADPSLDREPVSPRPMLNMAVAFVLGLMVSVFIVFFMESWENHRGRSSRTAKSAGA